MSRDLPLYKARCAYCRHWQPTAPRQEAFWGYCDRWRLAESPVVANGTPGPTLLESDATDFDRKVVTPESFGCNHIDRVTP